MIPRRQHRGLALAGAVALGVVTLGPSPSLANDCRAVQGVGASIDKFLATTRAAQAAGQGTMPVNDVLFGVTEIDAEDQQALAERALVQLSKRDDTTGAYESRGPETITVEGVFADRDTLFRIPELVLGQYTLSAEGAELVYDPEHPAEVGESALGIHFFKAIHRTVITPDRLAFFFEGNDDGEPDRCYDLRD
nr:hypothetical protein [uncultured Dongia sp.]